MVADQAEELPPGAHEAWKRVLARVRASIGDDLFEFYFYRLRLDKMSGDKLFVSTLTIKQVLLRGRFLTLLTEQAQREWPHILKVQVNVRPMGTPFVPVAKPPPRVMRVVDPTETPPQQQAEPESEAAAEAPPAEEVKPPQKRERIRIEDVIKACCIFYRLRRELILSPARGRTIVHPRQRCMYLCKQLTNRSLPEIGRMIGRRDHTTVLHSVHRVEQQMADDPKVAEEMALLTRYRPHVALVDLFVGSESGAEICERLRAQFPRCNVLLISGAGRISPNAARAAGAAGFISKDWPAADIAGAVRMVGLGMTVFKPHEAPGGPPLTDREREVLALIAEGSSNAQIARALGLSVKTVQNYVSRILDKLQLADRTQAALPAQRRRESP